LTGYREKKHQLYYLGKSMETGLERVAGDTQPWLTDWLAKGQSFPAGRERTSKGRKRKTTPRTEKDYWGKKTLAD